MGRGLITSAPGKVCSKYSSKNEHGTTTTSDQTTSFELISSLKEQLSWPHDRQRCGQTALALSGPSPRPILQLCGIELKLLHNILTNPNRAVLAQTIMPDTGQVRVYFFSLILVLFKFFDYTYIEY